VKETVSELGLRCFHLGDMCPVYMQLCLFILRRVTATI
jgi:hypothetical protein